MSRHTNRQSGQSCVLHLLVGDPDSADVLNNGMLKAALRHPSPVQEFEEIKTHIPRCNLSTQELGKCIANYGFKPCFIRRALAHKLIKADMSVHWSDININW
jgi:hypothetical protein